MIGATALSALLMASVLAVVSGLHRKTAAVRDTSVPAVMSATIQLVRQDLQLSDAWESHSPGIVLAGRCALGAGQERSHMPARVRYRIAQVRNRPWLIREQAVLHESEAPGTIELLVAGVREIRLETITDEASDPLRPSPRTVPVPGQVRLVMVAGESTIDEVLTIR